MMNSTKADGSQLCQDDLEKLRPETLRRQLHKAFDESSEQQTDADYDGGLAVSQILAALALGLGVLVWCCPNPVTIFAGGWTIAVLFVFNAINQKQQRKMSWARAEFCSKPSNSNLWIFGLPVVMAAVAYAFLGNRLMQIDHLVLAKWGIILLCTICSSALIANKRVLGKLSDKYVGALNGVIFGAALAIATVFATVAVLSGHYWEYSASLALPLVGIWYSGGMIKRLLLRVDREKAFSVFLHSFFGAVAIFALGVAPELRDSGISVAERAANSGDQFQNDIGLGLLSLLSAQGDVEQDCNPDSAPYRSVVAALTPVSAEQANKAYFLMTGKAGFHLSPVTGEDLLKGETAIGAVRKGLSLQDALLTGHVDSQSLTSALYWTMVFHNQSEEAQEARATIALPRGSTVSRVTLWVNGVPQEAAFNSTAQVKQAYQWIVKRNRDPLLVTETAPNQVTLQAFPVPKWGDMKVRIGITCPLQPQSKRSFNFGAPHLLSANFDYKNAVTEIKMESDADANVTDSKSSKANGSHILMGNLKTEEEKNYFFNVNRSADFDQITTRASHSAEDSLISERLLSTHRERLRKLAVVVEANTLLADQKKDLANWLQNLPDKIETKAIFASRHEAATPLAISEFNKKLETISLDPGSKDSAALAQAKELIGRDKYGAVLWIHGPQPVVFQEDDADLKSLMDRGARRLKIYDCQLGGAQANEIANYMRKLDVDASPRFIRVDDAQSLKERLTKLEQAQFGAGDDLVVERTKLPNFHKQTVIQDFPTVSRVSSLWAADEARKAASLGDENAAVLLGTAYRVVTPVTGAVVMEKASDYEYQNLKRNFYDVVPASAHAPAGTADGTSTLAQSPPANLFSQGMFSSLPMPGTAYDMNFAQAPSLEGATNGTIGPQGTDADFVTGVNTAGGVRVNNLANLEALLLLTANGLLLLGVIWGTVTLLKGVFGSSSVTNAKRLIYGSAAILFGLMSPATISFLLATARDANLFS